MFPDAIDLSILFCGSTSFLDRGERSIDVAKYVETNFEIFQSLWSIILSSGKTQLNIVLLYTKRKYQLVSNV